MNKTTGTAVAGETKKDYIKTGQSILCKAKNGANPGFTRNRENEQS